MDNKAFLRQITLSFEKFLITGSRSNEKLKILHGSIAKDLFEHLGSEYDIHSLGFGNGKETCIEGRYIDKMVDITILKHAIPIAGIGVKFVMQNYAQNSNNYFENMLGETANIRCNRIPYFQILIIPDKMPYYDNNGILKKWELFTEHNAFKYKVLSKDNVEITIHTPTKTLLYVIHLPEIQGNVEDKKEYISYYQNMEDLCISESQSIYGKFDNSVIFNDYEDFISKIIHYIKFQG